MTPYYKQDGITIYHGDCREILPTLVKADVVLTDPPYGILAEKGSSATKSGGWTVDEVAWDIAPERELIDHIRASADIQFIWGGCHLPLPPTYGYLVWDKQIDGMTFGEVEMCWTNQRFAPRIFRFRVAGFDKRGRVHPTQKPEALMLWCLSFAPGNVVLDPFMGSGTTLVAAKRLGRTAIGIEREEKYCEVAVKRLQQGALPFYVSQGETPHQSRGKLQRMSE